MTPAFSFSLLLVICQYVEAQYRNGDIRLMGGSYQWEGRVEIYKSGRWGTITDTQWSIGDAQVVCRKLGHFKPGAISRDSAYFGEGSNPILMDYISCTGTEYSLTDCVTRSTSRQSDHSEDVGVQCQPADGSYREGDIRLVGGSHDWEGRVEVYMAGTWGTVSDGDWREDDAQVVCRQLGFPTDGAVAQCCAHYGQGSGPVQVQNVVCLGPESNLRECSHSDTPSGDHGLDVGVQCQPRAAAVSLGTIRLVEGSYQWEGRVEIFLSGTWGTISSDQSIYEGAWVVCRQLGYTGDYVYAHSNGHSTSGHGPIAMRNPVCSGNEYRLTECRYDLDTSSSTHSSDWAAKCSAVSPQEGDVNLNGARVEVFVSGKWGTISSNTWTIANSQVLCRQLGYKVLGTQRSWPGSRDSRTDPPQLISVVNCTGSETKLLDCPFTTVETDGGTVFVSDVHVSCNQESCSTGQMRLVGGQSAREGRLEICFDDYGSWRTICDKHWSPLYTTIPCRHFGFADHGEFFDSSMFGQGAGPILDGYLNCNGSEGNILNCRHFSHDYSGCTHTNDVSIRCEPAPCSDGQLRKVDGVQMDPPRGVLEVCLNQRWGIVQNYDDAIPVVCRQLGYSPQGFLSRIDTVDVEIPVHLTYVRCFGTESNIFDCSYGNNTNKGGIQYPTRDGLYCEPASCRDGEVRLTEGENELEGRLEMCFNQRWGTVSDDGGWSEASAQVVCSDLGYEINPSQYVFNYLWHSWVSLPFHMENVNCSGSEGTLLHCSNSSGSPYNHSRDVGVKCQKPTCRDGDVRLMNGRNKYEGLVEVCFNRRWGTIHNYEWEYFETSVVCRQLGYSNTGHDYHQYNDYDSAISSPVHLTKVRCNGQEQKITDCRYKRVPLNYSFRGNDANVAVRCQHPVDPTPSRVSTSSPYPTTSPTAHPSYTVDHGYINEGCWCPDTTCRNASDSVSTDKKFTAVLAFAIVSWVITALAVAVAVGTTIYHCLSNRKKSGSYDQLQLQNPGSNDSIPDVVDAEGRDDAYCLPSVEVRKSALL